MDKNDNKPVVKLLNLSERLMPSKIAPGINPIKSAKNDSDVVIVTVPAKLRHLVFAAARAFFQSTGRSGTAKSCATIHVVTPSKIEAKKIPTKRDENPRMTDITSATVGETASSSRKKLIVIRDKVIRKPGN